MRTDITPILNSQMSASSKGSAEIGLTNQLLEVGVNQPEFNRVLEQQSRKSAPPSTHNQHDSRPEKQSSSRSEAKPDRDSGKPLPSDRAEHQQQAKQTEDSRRSKEQQRKDQIDDHRQSNSRQAADKLDSEADEQRLVDRQTQQRQVIHCQAKSDSDKSSADSSPEMLNSLNEELSSLEQSELTQFSDEIVLAPEQVLENTEQPIQISNELLEKAKQTLQADQSEADLDLALQQEDALSALSEEERQLLEQQMLKPEDVEGEGFVDGQSSLIDENTDPAATQAQVSLQQQPAFTAEPLDADVVSNERQSVKPSISSSQAAQSTNQAADKSAIQETLELAEPESWELGKEKKADVNQQFVKPELKVSANEASMTSPVQERLAALAKALDRMAGGGEKSSSGTSPVVDAAKPTTIQRGSESLIQAQTQANPTRVQNSAIQTPMQAGLQNAMMQREWASELGQRLMMMVASKLQSAQIQLNPREMGPIDIKVVMQQEQANVVFSSQVTQTREAIEQAIPRLREMFEESGVGLADVDVRDQDAHQSKQREGQQAQQGKSWQNDSASEDDVVSENTVVQSVGLVDYYA